MKKLENVGPKLATLGSAVISMGTPNKRADCYIDDDTTILAVTRFQIDQW